VRTIWSIGPESGGGTGGGEKLVLAEHLRKTEIISLGTGICNHNYYDSKTAATLEKGQSVLQVDLEGGE